MRVMLTPEDLFGAVLAVLRGKLPDGDYVLVTEAYVEVADGPLVDDIRVVEVQVGVDLVTDVSDTDVDGLIVATVSADGFELVELHHDAAGSN